MKVSQLALGWALVGAAALSAMPSVAHASEYPSRPIDLIVPVTTGGRTDIVARAFADTARRYLPAQPIVVVNKPGASGAIGFADVIG